MGRAGAGGALTTGSVDVSGLLVVLAFVGPSSPCGCTCSTPIPGDRSADRHADWTTATGTTGATGETGAGPELAWVMLDGGATESCGVLDDDRLVCWGDPDYVSASPTGPFVQGSVGTWSGCALDPDGYITCWCPHPSPSEQHTCDDVPAGPGFVEVQNGGYHACAERPDHTLRCWGTPVVNHGVPTEPVLDWSIELNGGCAVLLDGTVSCWGDDLEALWGDSDPPALLAPPEGLKYTQVALGRSHGCALDVDGEAHCWGRTGLLGPFPPAPPGPWASIVAFNQMTCGLRANGSADCWYDLPGILDQWFIPDERWASLGLGEWSSCGLTLDGRGLCFPAPYDHVGEQLVPDLDDL